MINYFCILWKYSNTRYFLREDDPDLTDKKFPGNPTKSYRSTYPFKVVGEVTIWQGHPYKQVKEMKEHLERLKEQGINSLID